MMERARVTRFAVICLPHLCDQWQQELRAKLGIDAVIIAPTPRRDWTG